MNKKKHQGDPGEDVSTESCDENENNVECSHINKAVDLAKVKKSLIKTGIQTECEQCKKLPPPSNNGSCPVADDLNGFLEFDNSLWMCLRCGHQACGRSKNEHALQHYKTPRSDCHALCVDTTLWSVWCYECDDTINVTCKKKLMEAVDYLRKFSTNENRRLNNDYNNPSSLAVVPYSDASPTTSLGPQENVMACGSNNSTGATPKTSFNSILSYSSNAAFSSSNTTTNNSNQLPRPRGLMNLGNTCFFNSVVQCLAQTPYLLNLLNETSEPGQYFKLPGGKLDPRDPNSPVLEPLEGHLEKWRPLTSTLAETLSELTNGRTESYVPRMLLSRFTCKVPQFRGGDQHDSHELLRHLLEAVREEDLRRYQAVILEKLGLNKKVDPSTVEGDKKKVIKFYGQQASELLLPTEQIFRGVLVSTLQCQQCQHTSHRDEFFLDLSLPISEKQMPPQLLRRKADDNIEDGSKPSKHQIKKEKKAERKKNKKHQQKGHTNNINNSLASRTNNLNDDGSNLMGDDDVVVGMTGISSSECQNDDVNNGGQQTSPQTDSLTAGDSDVNMDKSDSESDADVEDNIEGTDDQMQTGSGNAGLESGYNSDKISDKTASGSSPENSGAHPAHNRMLLNNSLLLHQRRSSPVSATQSSSTNLVALNLASDDQMMSLPSGSTHSAGGSSTATAMMMGLVDSGMPSPPDGSTVAIAAEDDSNSSRAMIGMLSASCSGMGAVAGSFGTSSSLAGNGANRCTPPDNSPAEDDEEGGGNESETNLDLMLGSPLGGHCSPEEDSNDIERPVSRFGFNNNTINNTGSSPSNRNIDLKTGLSKLSLLNDGDSTKINALCLSDTTRMEADDDDDNNNSSDDVFEGGAAAAAPAASAIPDGGVLTLGINLGPTNEEKMEEDDQEEEQEEEEEETTNDDDQDVWTNTITARYKCEEGEYSVQSCLNQFTACELMTNNNKVACEQCTRRANNNCAGAGPDNKKTVYTNATKQLLIYNPPAVLILHLKRFQVYRFRSAKVSKFVKFPMILDLAPFCSKRSQSLPTFEAGQTKVLYSLYGIVEHSGSMHGGHYVAYVKVRPRLDENSYRWQFLPKNQQKLLQNHHQQDSNSKLTSSSAENNNSSVGSIASSSSTASRKSLGGGAFGEPEAPPGKWYYISDSHVSEAPESRVLAAQAYLLFYERIL